MAAGKDNGRGRDRGTELGMEMGMGMGIGEDVTLLQQHTHLLTCGSVNTNGLGDHITHSKRKHV